MIMLIKYQNNRLQRKLLMFSPKITEYFNHLSVCIIFCNYLKPNYSFLSYLYIFSKSHVIQAQEIIFYKEDKNYMLYKHFQPPLSPRNPQINLIQNTQNAIPKRIIVGSPPPVQVMPPSPRATNSPSQHYMMHLVPQQVLSHSPHNFNKSSQLFRPESSIINKFSQKKSQPSTQSILILERPQTIIHNPNLASTGFRSVADSQENNNHSRQTVHTIQRKQYLIPQSPTNLRRMEPVRRVSQHRLNISSADKQGQQQNIKIVIQTNSPRNQVGTPSKITIEHTKGATTNPLSAKNGSFVMNTLPQTFQSIPIQIPQTPKMVVMTQNKVQRNTEIINNCTVNQATASKMLPQKIEQNLENRNHSYSVDSKQISKQSKSKEPNFKHNEQIQPDVIVLDPPSDLFVDQKPISFSDAQNERLASSKTSKKSQPLKKHQEKEFSSQKSSKYQRNKLSIQSSKVKTQERKKVQNEIYNEYYDSSDLQSYTSGKETQLRGHYLYQERKTLFTSALLLNQIYECEVSKALLKMNVVQNKSREKSLKRRDL